MSRRTRKTTIGVAPSHNDLSGAAARIQSLFDAPIAFYDLLDEIPLGLVILDRHQRIIAANRPFEVLTGFNREAIVGIACRLILRTNLCPNDCPVDLARAGSGPVTREGNLIDRQRRRINIRVSAAMLKGTDGRSWGFIQSVEEIRAPAQDVPAIDRAGIFSRVLGRSPKMVEVFNVLPAVSQTDSFVLITGETGTGKDLVAELIHKASQRSRGPFIKVNCGALPETLLESELFGHMKGAFTGAVSDKPGRFKMAHGGTLFLTEIGDLPPPLQIKLLTFLDDHVVYPLGAAQGFQADVRVIAATHRHLEQMVHQGTFRQDLLYRLNVIRVHLPPLRERDGDARLLLDYFLATFAQRLHKKVNGFSAEAIAFLSAHPYPGNVREVRNIVEYAVGIVDGDTIGMKHLPSYLFDALPPHLKAGDAPRMPEAPAAAASDANRRWPEVERAMILDALVRANGRRAKAAEILGLGRSTLWRKMKQYGISH